MTRIAVFDSGLGSISIIKPIRKIMKSEIIYFADQKNFPYGMKSKIKLDKIIHKTIDMLNKKFKPDLIVIGSNTPTLVLKNLTSRKIIGVLPPLRQASKISKTNNIAILATQLVVKSKELTQFIRKSRIPSKTNVLKVNATPLVELVESGKFLSDPKFSQKIIKKTLDKVAYKNNIDVMTLSSTHLPFLSPLLKKEYPKITFLNPANDLAKKLSKLNTNKSQRNTIKIFTSKNSKILQKQLHQLGINHKVNFLTSF